MQLIKVLLCFHKHIPKKQICASANDCSTSRGSESKAFLKPWHSAYRTWTAGSCGSLPGLPEAVQKDESQSSAVNSMGTTSRHCYTGCFVWKVLNVQMCLVGYGKRGQQVLPPWTSQHYMLWQGPSEPIVYYTSPLLPQLGQGQEMSNTLS